jgi:two-component system OmpR family sensor kinase
MSLRSRLTLYYTSLVGGILLLFGVAVYVSVSFTVTHQLDSALRSSAELVVSGASIDRSGLLQVIPVSMLELPTDVYVQVWRRGTVLIDASPNITWYRRALDPIGIRAALPVYRDATVGKNRLRVLTVPLVIGIRPAGVIQLGTSLEVVEATQRTLLIILLIGTLAAIGAAGLAGWYSTQQVLSPLQDSTQAAMQITHADDLSRRIPYRGPPSDELGQLIHAFNQTLTRLESLFNTQRRFIADVGHELRTPLTVIKGNTNLMRILGCMDEESLGSIESEVDRLTRLVGDLLLLAQAESGKIPLAHQLVELDTLVLEVMNQMRVLVQDRIKLRLGDMDQVLVCGDRDRLKQVLVNLVGNAINYTPAGGEVLVALGKEQNQARLTVSDTGPGIAPEDLPHIFERFYRGEKSRTRSRDGKGFGLGLSIAYWIVRNHDGRIEVDSKVGSGTTFAVWLPLAVDGCVEEKIPTS